MRVSELVIEEEVSAVSGPVVADCFGFVQESRTKSLLGLSSLDLSGVTPSTASKRSKILSDASNVQEACGDVAPVAQTLMERAAQAKSASHSARRSLLVHSAFVDDPHPFAQSKIIYADGSSIAAEVPVVEKYVNASGFRSTLADHTSFSEPSQRDVRL
jgi:hypothetical protein